MITYKIPPLTKNLKLSESFIIVKRKNHKHLFNELINIYDYANNFLGSHYIIDSKTIVLNDIKPKYTFLHLNLNKDLYLKIMQYRGYKLSDQVDILTLTNTKIFNHD